MINKEIIDYLLSKSGNLDSGETWYDVGVKFGLQPKDIERAKIDKSYARQSIKLQAYDIWKLYLKSKNNLKLSKETYHNGKLKFETYKEKPEDVNIDHEKFDIKTITTNPYGGAWIKLQKKEEIFTEQHTKDLAQILTENIKPVEYSFNKKHNSKALFIYGSDKHIGALTKDNSIYTNDYDKKEIIRRLVYLILQDIELKVNIFGTPESLYIMDLGDALDGFNGKTTGGLRGTSSHTLPQQFNNREQHDIYVEVHKQLFDELVSRAYSKNIYFIATSNSNHGGDFEYGAMKNLETYLNIKYPFINTFINTKPFNHFIYGTHCIIFGHGKDDEDMKNGLPLVLNDKVENFINDYIRINKLENYNISVITGDLHQSAETYGKNFRYKKVLSQFGSTKWMHTNFGSGHAGISSEIYESNTSIIYKTDTFFNIQNISNTGINI